MNLKQNDIVYSPCTNFNEGSHYFEEKKVISIGEDFIELKTIATLKNIGNELVRTPILNSETRRGDKKERDFYSRPLSVIMSEYKESTDWFVQRLIADEKKYGV